MKIGITGATGQLGRLVVDYAKKSTSPSNIVALVRDPEKAKDLGVEVRAFDYNKPEALEAQLKGIDRLLLISGSEIGKRVQQHENVIKAAKATGIKLLAYTSLLHTDSSPIFLASEHLPTEKILRASGITYAILRNGWYTENYTQSISQNITAGAVFGCAGQGKISAAARKDYAEAAAVVLTGEGHEFKIYELAGDESFTLSDLAAEISKQTGKKIVYNNLSEAELVEVLKNAGLPEQMAGAFASIDTHIANGALYDNSHQLSQLIGRKTTPLSAVVKEAI
ncbi:SDR family oxidoreductase [Xiashengella succiniciproducens]|uniref:SDR family oxidoreductase n=1 Tax=Xiashengella succiniciproducens TaxID=2949635 RepID=A0A9J6ZN60_9BACT|nr:SDR family oxidoreductase [Alkaliflexus sp. Ai-910]URW78704.1 SDR family oxidoreductase [Alkaliflexus sp. Ai-910]